MFVASGGLAKFVTMVAMLREPEFLIAAVRRFLGAGEPLPESVHIDWKALLTLAEAHAVTPMLHHALRDLDVPSGPARDIRNSFQRSVVWSLGQSAELVR